MKALSRRSGGCRRPGGACSLRSTWLGVGLGLGLGLGAALTLSRSSSSLRFACSFLSCSSRSLSLRSVALFVLTFELTSLRATLRFVAFDRVIEAPDRCDASEPTTETASSSFSTSFSAAARAVLVGGAPLVPPCSLKLSISTLCSLSTRSRQQSEYCCAVILKGCGTRRRQALNGHRARLCVRVC